MIPRKSHKLRWLFISLCTIAFLFLTFFIWLQYYYAPNQFERYVTAYNKELEICPAINSFPNKLVLKMGFDAYKNNQAKKNPSEAYLMVVAYISLKC